MLLPVRLRRLSSTLSFHSPWLHSRPRLASNFHLTTHTSLGFPHPYARLLSIPVLPPSTHDENPAISRRIPLPDLRFPSSGPQSFSPHSPSASESDDVRSFLLSLGVGVDGFCKIVVTHPHLLRLGVVEDLKGSVDLLKSAVGKDLIAECIVAWPSLVSMTMSQKAGFEDQMSFLLGCGFKKHTKLLAKALNSALKRSKEELEATLRALMSHGLARAHACKLVRVQPTILSQAPMELGRKVDYILHTFCFSPEELLKNSSFFIYDLESHLRPRYLMYRWVQSKRIMRRNFKLDYVMSLSENHFWCKFVECHAEGPRMYEGFLGNAKAC